MRLSSIDAVWFGTVFGSFISSFSTFPGGEGGGDGWLKSKIQLSSAWAELGNNFLSIFSPFQPIWNNFYFLLLF